MSRCRKNQGRWTFSMQAQTLEKDHRKVQGTQTAENDYAICCNYENYFIFIYYIILLLLLFHYIIVCAFPSNLRFYLHEVSRIFTESGLGLLRSSSRNVHIFIYLLDPIGSLYIGDILCLSVCLSVRSISKIYTLYPKLNPSEPK